MSYNRDNSSSGGAWSSSRSRGARDEVDAVNDKFASAFSRNNASRGGDREDRGGFGDRRSGGFGSRGDAAPLKVNSRTFGDLPPREGERESRGFGGDRDRDSRGGGFGGDRSSGGFRGGDREERGFGGPRGGDREERGFGGPRGGDREERGFGGPRGGDREDRPRDDRPREDRPRSDFRARRDESGWEDDPRFANKFGGGGARGGDRRGGGDRGGRGSADFLPRRERDALTGGPSPADAMAPLPSAPKSAAANSATVPKQTVFDMAMSKASKQPAKSKTANKKTEEAASPAEATPVAPTPAPAPVVPTHSKTETTEVVTAALTSGQKGEALSSAIKSSYAAKDLTVPIHIFAATSAILSHVAASSEAFLGKWYKPEEYGAALKALVADRPMREQIDALYAVQDYCARNKFPKLDVKGKQKKLIEVIMTALLVSEVVDVDTILAWADDEVDRDDVPGRVDAIVQMTTMLTTLREPDDVDEEDIDEEAFTRQYVK